MRVYFIWQGPQPAPVVNKVNIGMNFQAQGSGEPEFLFIEGSIDQYNYSFEGDTFFGDYHTEKLYVQYDQNGIPFIDVQWSYSLNLYADSTAIVDISIPVADPFYEP